jgi:hypothetical protein
MIVTKEHPDTRKERTWYELCQNDYQINVMVVEAPLTFGHSQFILRSNRNISEDAMFNSASITIKECLKVLRNKLPSAIKNITWKELSDYTNTKGRYIKTLILRTSAHEEKNEYKVHLVPYFRSHRDSARILFQHVHTVEKNKKGGLLCWLAERERRVDNQIEIWRDTSRFPTDLVNSFRLIELAKYLKNH